MSAGGHLATGSLRIPGPAAKAVFGVTICDCTRDAAIERLRAALRDERHLRVAFCNAHTANLAWDDVGYRRTLAGFTVFADGVGVDIAARALHGAPFLANLNGTDFVPALLAAEPRPLRLALYGARPGVAARAAATLSRLAPQHAVRLVGDGYGDAAQQQRFLAQLSEEPVDVLLVALGNPRQEEWIARNIDGRQATLAIGVGALFDFLADEAARAPLPIRRMRLEWAYRLAREPRRLFRRYALGNPLFLWRVLLGKLGARRLP